MLSLLEFVVFVVENSQFLVVSKLELAKMCPSAFPPYQTILHLPSARSQLLLRHHYQAVLHVRFFAFDYAYALHSRFPLKTINSLLRV